MLWKRNTFPEMTKQWVIAADMFLPIKSEDLNRCPFMQESVINKIGSLP